MHSRARGPADCRVTRSRWPLRVQDRVRVPREWCDPETSVHTHLYTGSTFQRCHGIAELDELEREGA